MYSKIAALAALVAFAEARFGQEGAVQNVISALGNFGNPGQAATLAGASPGVLLGGANACAKLELADEIVATLGNDPEVIAAAAALVAAEKNFNPFASSIPTICSDASLPATPELRGIVPAVDPAVAGSDVENANAATSITTPFNADGLSQADVAIANGFTNFTSQGSDGSTAAPAGGNAGGDAGNDAGNGNNGNGNNGNGNNGNGNNGNGNNGNGNNGNGNNGNGNGNAGCGAVRTLTTVIAAPTQGADAGNGNNGNGNGNGNNGNNGNGNNGNGNNGNGNNGNGNNGNGNNGNNGNGNGNNGNGNGNNGNGNNGNNGNGNGNNGNGNGNGNNAAADFGSCDPTIQFTGGLGGRPATEFTFQSNDAQIAANQQEALNPNIITNRICDELTNICGANQAAKDICEDAQAQIQALGTRDATTADAWNALVGV